MIQTEQLKDTETRFRNAVAGGNFREAERRLFEYRQAVDAALADGSASRPEQLAVLDHAEEVFTWARRMVLSNRAAAEQLFCRRRAAKRYFTPRPAHSWELKG